MAEGYPTRDQAATPHCQGCKTRSLGESKSPDAPCYKVSIRRDTYCLP